MAGEQLTGAYRIRAIRPAFSEAFRLFQCKKQSIALRRHALKLRYWPENYPETESGLILDLDWSWIRSLPNMNVGELRIQETINGHDNLRVIFFVGDPAVRKPLPIIWVLRVMQKRRDDFSKHDIATFKARRLLVLERFYS